MRDLEDILRRASHRALPVEAPTGGFAEVSKQLVRQQASSAKRLAWWVLLPLLAGGVLAVTLYPLSEEEVVGELVTPVEATAATTTNLAARTDEDKYFPDPSLVQPAEPVLPVAVGTPQARTKTDPSTEGVAPETAPQGSFSTGLAEQADQPGITSPTEVGKQALASQPKPSNLPGTGDRALMPLPIPDQAPRVATTLKTNSELPKVVSASTLPTGPKSFRIFKPLREKLKGWEVSMSWNAIIGEPGNNNVFRVTDDPTETNSPALSGTEIINGSPRTIYGMPLYTHDGAPSRKVEYTFLQLQLNRQFASGWRVGLGAVALLRRLNDDDLVSEVAAEENNASLLYITSRTRNNYWIVQGQAGYTFQIGRRWRPWVAASVNVGLRSYESYESFWLADGMRSSAARIESWTNGIASADTNVFLALTGGVQYRISNRFSAGFNLAHIPKGRDVALPLPGLEVRIQL